MLEFKDVYDELEDFVYWLADREQRSQIHLMDFDELTGELFEEMWKVWLYYRDDIDDMEQMKAVMRRTFDNRVKELVYKYARTHRAAKLGSFSLDVDPDSNGPDIDNNRDYLEGRIIMNIGAEVRVDTDELYISKLRVDETLARLSDEASRVFSAVVFGHPLLEAQLQLSGMRAAEVYKGGGTVKVKKWHVANALAMKERDVRKAFKEIQKVYQEVLDEYGA